MKKFLIILILPLILSCSKLGGLTNKKETESNKRQHTGTISEIQPGENTYGVVAGVLEWSDKDFPPFEKRNRKDKEFYELLKTRGADKNVKLLIDDEASLKNIKSQIEKALDEAPEGSTFLFYYAGHGVKADDNMIYFANSDIKGSNYRNSGFSVQWLGDIITKKFKGRLVWLLADCCYSGALLDEADKINSAGKNVIALSSARTSNISTANWTYSQTIIDCFSGLPLADHNSDGFISLKETAEELKNSMKFREHQLSGYKVKDIDESSAISKTDGIAPDKGSSEFTVGSYCYALKGSDWETVRIVDSKNNKLVCEFYDYSDKSLENINTSELKPAYFVTHKNGEKVKVEWEKKWYDAKIIESDNDFCFIKYEGYEDFWNEWVAYERIKTGSEKTAQVEWKGTWYPAIVHEESGNKYFISYTGYAFTWDEWVNSSRIKF
jgi:hypothetical protein